MNILNIILTIFISLSTLIVFTGCGDRHVKHDKYKIESITLTKVEDEHKNHIESSIGIPTPVQTNYHYDMTLTNDIKDTFILSFIRKNRIDMDEFVGDSIYLHKNLK